jgi:hypothetical protein
VISEAGGLLANHREPIRSDVRFGSGFAASIQIVRGTKILPLNLRGRFVNDSFHLAGMLNKDLAPDGKSIAVIAVDKE